MNDCLVTYIESDVFDSIINESVKQRFQNISTTKKKKTNLNTNKFLLVTLQYYNRGDKQKGDFIRMKYKNLSIMKKNIT